MITLDGIVLPSDLEWVDEYSWSPVVQSREYSVSGALIIQEQAQQAGRPVTLSGGNEASWITKATLELLRSKLNTANLVMTLSYHGQVKSVVFDQSKNGLTARIIRRIANPGDTEFYSVDLFLLEV